MKCTHLIIWLVAYTIVIIWLVAYTTVIGKALIFGQESKILSKEKFKQVPSRSEAFDPLYNNANNQIEVK